MNDTLKLQAAEGETPDETKRSVRSIFRCRISHASIIVCPGFSF